MFRLSVNLNGLENCITFVLKTILILVEVVVVWFGFLLCTLESVSLVGNGSIDDGDFWSNQMLPSFNI